MGSKRLWGGALAALLAGVLAWGQPATGPEAATKPQPPAYKNTALSFEDRAKDLLSRMTVEQKAVEIQMLAYAIKTDKVDIPGINWWSEALHGIGRNGRATQFPQAMGMAAAWDPELMHEIGNATADEARAKYVAPTILENDGRYSGLTIWAPTINMARDPRWGRNQETYGEDPVLTSRLAVEYVKGLQGADPRYLKAVATPKHFAMNSQETGRTSLSFDVSERTLREYYLPAFHACFVEGKAASAMAAHNGINKVPCTVNHWLLTDLLRGEWGFTGAVVTDWNAIQYLQPGYHNVAQGNSDASAMAIKAGVDVLCNERPTNLAPYVVNAINDKQMTEADLDQAVLRGLLLRFRLGMFDPPEMVPFNKIPKSVVGCDEHLALALRAARESMVLLQNDPVKPGYGFEKLLPLDLRKVHSIGVVGPFADVAQLGNYPGVPVKPITPLQGIKELVGDRVRVETALWSPQAGDPGASAVELAKTCDVVVVVVGLTAGGNDRGIGGDNTSMVEMEGVDRATLELSPSHKSLIKRVTDANPKTIVVLEGGNDIGTDWMKSAAPAIIMAWYPGEQGGKALAEILLGAVNPSGRLPMTFYPGIVVDDNVDLPPLNDYEISKGRTYMYRTKPVSYVFGYGLSYTTYEYKNIKAVLSGQTATVSLDVTNTGKRGGEEVVQVYLHKPSSVVSRPIKQLAGFVRAAVGAGETKSVQIPVQMSDVAYWDVKTHAFVIEPGKYDVQVGASSADIRLNTTVEVK